MAVRRKSPGTEEMFPPPNRQSALIERVGELVDGWRGFALEDARKPYPSAAPRYAPASEGEHEASETTVALLRHWFSPEPHEVRAGAGTVAFKYWPHQRRLVETIVYLREVRRITRVEELYRLTDFEVKPQQDPWPKLGGQLATGSGKTKMMSLLIAWAYLNATLHPGNPMGFGRHMLLIAPGLFVRDRLLQDFSPEDGPSVFATDPVIPAELRGFWDLHVYGPSTCPLKLDPAQGALVITNIHQLLRAPDEPTVKLDKLGQAKLDLLFGPEPKALEGSSTPLIEKLRSSKGLLVINDEAHHVWDEPGHQQYAAKQAAKGQKSGGGGGEEATRAMAWIRALRALNGAAGMKSRLALQVDLSATLFEESGGAKKGKGSGAEAPKALFRHTVVRYDLKDAIEDHIVKRPILEHVTVKKEGSEQKEPLIREGQPNAWEKYRNMLVPGIQRWRQVRDVMVQEGDRRKPILFILCEDRSEAREIANYLSYGTASQQDLTGQPLRGYEEPESKERLFLHRGAGGVEQSTVVEIHIGQKEESNEAEWEKIRRTVNQIDRDEVLVEDEEGNKILVPNPCNVVVSVMMLKEGWDVRNVKVIVPLRPCDSRTLTEQMLGRGLRKMHPPEVQEDGSVAVREEYLYVIDHPSFDGIIDQLKDILTDLPDGAAVPMPKDYRPISPLVDPAAREARDVLLTSFQGLRRVVTSWAKQVDARKLPALDPKEPWQEELSRSLIETTLRVALEGIDREGGQSFELEETPSYRSYKHVLEHAYVVPILRELHAGKTHKNDVMLIVEKYLEQKTFQLPRGIPLSFAGLMDSDSALITLGNLARAEVLDRVRKALVASLRVAMLEDVPTEEANLLVKHGAELGEYQALDRNVREPLQRSPFGAVAVENKDELRVARLLDDAKDVAGWVYNHRQGVGYFIEYDQGGKKGKYYPDFVARARLGAVMHNVIVEVKGRMDDKDKLKAQAALGLCDLLTQHSGEPWHYLFLQEDKASQRQDISWWESLSSADLGSLLRHQEEQPLYGVAPSLLKEPETPLLADVPEAEKFRRYLPVYDLENAAQSLVAGAQPERLGWRYALIEQPLSSSMFLARIGTGALGPKAPAGSLGLFRKLPGRPAPRSLDGRRLVVVLNTGQGGPPPVLLRRLRIVSDGEQTHARLEPDNHAMAAEHLPEIESLAIAAELLRIVGTMAPLDDTSVDAFLQQIYELDQSSKRKALRRIFQFLDEALLDKNLERCKYALRKADPGKLSVTAALGFLSITLQAKGELGEPRQDYLARLTGHLKENRPEEMAALLKGLG